MLGPITEAKRHQSTPLETQLPGRRGYRSISGRASRELNIWNREEALMATRWARLPDMLASLESFQE